MSQIVPSTAAQAMTPEWLTGALSPLTGGAPVTEVKIVETIKVMATKIRFIAAWEGGEAALCLKAFLDLDEQTARAGIVGIVEADFYTRIAPSLGVRVPACVATAVDRKGGQGAIIMRDLIPEGTHFCTALEPFSLDEAAASLEQLARLHAGAALLQDAPWIERRISFFTTGNFMPQSVLQELLDGVRGDGLEPRVRDAGRLIAGLKALERADALLPQTLIHGDCHAGNIFKSAAGPGLIDWQLFQHGNWALDVAYHIAAVLPVEVAEQSEWKLLDHYLQLGRSLGVALPATAEARLRYRAAVVYGYYLWAITRRVDPNIINVFVNRLGSAVSRHDSYALLSVS
jgi:aminoglycoside phosphotransferase (APT) family kinase protein